MCPSDSRDQTGPIWHKIHRNWLTGSQDMLLAVERSAFSLNWPSLFNSRPKFDTKLNEYNLFFRLFMKLDHNYHVNTPLFAKNLKAAKMWLTFPRSYCSIKVIARRSLLVEWLRIKHTNNLRYMKEKFSFHFIDKVKRLQ